MPWSKILRNFRMIPHNPSAADFHGPYNKLLYTLFPLDNDFTVFPRYEPVDPEELESSAVTERFFFDVRYDDKPVFILEHKAPQELKYGSVRDSADRKLRDHVEDARCKLSSIRMDRWAVPVLTTAFDSYYSLLSLACTSCCQRIWDPAMLLQDHASRGSVQSPTPYL
jgi:hypothetical protein